MYRLVYNGIYVSPESSRVDSRRPPSRVGNDSSGHKPSRRHRPEFGNRYTVTSNDKRLPRLHLPKHRTGVVAELSLGYHLVHRLLL